MFNEEATYRVAWAVCEPMIDSQTYLEIVDFYYREAEIQDEKRNREWLALLTDDATYHMPIRMTREKGQEKSVLPREQGGFIVDDRAFIEIRVKREETEYAWAENPPSRTKHVVSNIRVVPGEKKWEYKVRSYVFLTVHRGEDLSYDQMVYERHDILRKIDGQFKIASRVVVPDQGRLTIDRITFFL